jgi:hypothetical protein
VLAVVDLVGDPPPAVSSHQQENIGKSVRTVPERHRRRRDRAVDVHHVDVAGAGRLVWRRLPGEQRTVVVERPRYERAIPYPLDMGGGQERLAEVSRVAGGVPADVGPERVEHIISECRGRGDGREVGIRIGRAVRQVGRAAHRARRRGGQQRRVLAQRADGEMG